MTLRLSLIALSASALAVGACSSFNFFEDNEVRLPGERIPVRSTPAPGASDAVSATPVSVPGPRANADWPQLNGGPARAIGHVAAPTSLSLAWTADMGSSSDGRIVSPPIVTGGKVIALDAGATVTAVDASSGGRLWSTNLTPEGEYAIDGFGGGVAAAGGQVFVSSGFGLLYALDAGTGGVVWTAPVRAPSRSAPVVSGGKVFVVTRQNRIFAFDAASGEASWDGQGVEQVAGILGGAAPASNGEVVVAPFSSGEMTAYLAASGRGVWNEDLGSARGPSGLAVFNDVSGDPVISNGVVYAASQSGRLVAVDLRTGDRRWTRSLGSTNPPWIAGDTLFLMGGGGVLSALDAGSGATRWSVPLGEFGDPEDREDPILWYGPVLAGGRLLVTSNDKRMLSLDPATGTIVASFPLPDPAGAAPVVANGTVYVLTEDATLAAFR